MFSLLFDLEQLQAHMGDQSLFSFDMRAELDLAGSSALHAHLMDGEAQEMMLLDNHAAWTKPSGVNWGAAGLMNATSVLQTGGDFGWNLGTMLNYANNEYLADVILHLFNGSEVMHANAVGTFGDRSPQWCVQVHANFRAVCSYM